MLRTNPLLWLVGPTDPSLWLTPGIPKLSPQLVNTDPPSDLNPQPKDSGGSLKKASGGPIFPWNSLR